MQRKQETHEEKLERFAAHQAESLRRISDALERMAFHQTRQVSLFDPQAKKDPRSRRYVIPGIDTNSPLFLASEEALNKKAALADKRARRNMGMYDKNNRPN